MISSRLEGGSKVAGGEEYNGTRLEASVPGRPEKWDYE